MSFCKDDLTEGGIRDGFLISNPTQNFNLHPNQFLNFLELDKFRVHHLRKIPLLLIVCQKHQTIDFLIQFTEICEINL